MLSCLVFLTPVPASPQLLEVNKQWHQHFRSMKQQYEQKVMEVLGAERHGWRRRVEKLATRLRWGWWRDSWYALLSGPHTPPLPLPQITELRQKLVDLQKQVTELEAEREQKQRDFDRKLLLAKSKIEMEEVSVVGHTIFEVPGSSQSPRDQ